MESEFRLDDTHADELVLNLWRVFPRLFRLIRWRDRLKGGGSIYHYEILGFLFERGTASMSQIGKFIGVSKSNLTPMVDSLVASGLVSRVTDVKDRRVVKAALTEAGKAVMEEGKLQTRREMRDAFASLSHKEQQEIVAAFQAMARLLPRLDDTEE